MMDIITEICPLTHFQNGKLVLYQCLHKLGKKKSKQILINKTLQNKCKQIKDVKGHKMYRTVQITVEANNKLK